MISRWVGTPGEAFTVGLQEVWEDGPWVGQKKELTNVVIEITEPQQKSIYHDDIVYYLNEFHGPADDGTPHFDVVAGWTFPESPSKNLVGDIVATDSDGEYFRKLCDSEKGNQLHSMVEKINRWGRNNRTLAQVFNVDRDLHAMFPPCLIHIQAFYRDGEISLTGYYRSHTLVKSYYGDIVSLARLQSWIANETNSGVGSLVVHSGSLHVRKKNSEHELARKVYQEIC